MLPGLLQQLRQELLAEGIDPDKAAQVIAGLQYCLADSCFVALCKIVSQASFVYQAEVERLSPLLAKEHL